MSLTPGYRAGAVEVAGRRLGDRGHPGSIPRASAGGGLGVHGDCLRRQLQAAPFFILK